MERPDGGIIILKYIEQVIPVRADYWGGPYIELTFGTTEYHPTEVINVWDYATDTCEIGNTPTGVAAAFEGWMDSQDEENPGWLGQYLENAR